MHPDDALNAGAAMFTPGGGGGEGGNVAARPPEPVQPDDIYYYEEDDDEAWMEEIHAEMEGQQQHQQPQVQQQPQVVLPPHAEEFWFPECRNCTCCHGYKHGCGCCITKGMQSCTCAGGTPSTTTTAPPFPRGSPPPKQKKQPPLCKFFTSPGGCRFGAKCRFAHA